VEWCGKDLNQICAKNPYLGPKIGIVELKIPSKTLIVSVRVLLVTGIKIIAELRLQKSR
jgi:hypothetical protein